MKKELIIGFCVVFSVFGIILIASISLNEKIKISKVIEISKMPIGENIGVCGIVKNKRTSPSETTFITLDDETASISVVFFKNEKDKAERVERNSEVCIKGTIQKYRNKTEIIGKGIFTQFHDTS